MKDNALRGLDRLRTIFSSFTIGQRAVALVGVAALLMGGFLVLRWVSTPNYAPLFSDLASEDASAVIEELDSQAIPYKLENGGATIMVPREQVYETRIALSGEGLPGSSDEGYSLLDDQGLGTSQFKEQTDFKRAMEAELANTVEGISGVNTAVVHLALPAKQVFADEQEPATASILVDTAPGNTLNGEQVQAVVHLVASSIDGLDPEKVTVADSEGRVLSSTDGASGGAATTRNQQVSDYQNDMSARVQAMLDKVVGPGNSTVQVTANLDFDKAVSESVTYESDPEDPPLSSSRTTETYTGPGANAQAGGVVGPDGQMDNTGTGGGESAYDKESVTEDNPFDTVKETREAAPGSVDSIHFAVILDSATAVAIDPVEVQALLAAGAGIDRERGDTIRVSTMPFDRSADDAAAAELAAAAAAAAKAEQREMLRNIAIVVVVLLALLLAWLKGRKRAKARAQATSYVVEQLRQENAARVAAEPVLETSPALTALEAAEGNAADELRDELTSLVERQPEDVATLLRGWLVDRP
ncbi:flagellar basal-body MS-ring/collar protein FliF [Nocardioides pacificus]